MNKILGNLLGAAVGDAMGAPTEVRSKNQIKEKFGGYVRDFFDPPNDTFGRNNKRGQITDDFSIAYETCWAIVNNGGVIDEETAKKALIYWSREENYYNCMAGPSTRAAIAKYQSGTVTNPHGFDLCNDNAKATNGAAMKISPISLFSGGNVEKAIENAVIVGSITHPNNISLSGACAIAAATSVALNNHPTLKDIFNAGIYGAIRGDEIGKKNFATLAGPSIVQRIKFAIDLGQRSDGIEAALENIADYIGSGLYASEAVPAVFGIIAAANGDPLESIYGGVNIGNDTDTVATMVGGIVGALHGSEVFPDGYNHLINQASGININELAKEIEKIIRNRA